VLEYNEEWRQAEKERRGGGNGERYSFILPHGRFIFNKKLSDLQLKYRLITPPPLFSPATPLFSASKAAFL